MKYVISTLVIIILIFFTVIFIQKNKINNLKSDYETEVKLKNALIDTVNYTRNKYGEIVAEKLTLQETIINLSEINNNLTTSQRELLSRIKKINKDKTIINAALIEAEAKIDSLIGTGSVIIKENSVLFSDSTEYLIYDILIKNVIPLNTITKPSILFKNLSMPNKQYIDFYWENNKKIGYPIKFSVSNSNPYFITNNINSYAIPELNKNKIKPTGWQKVGVWFKKNGKTFINFGIGVGVGAVGTYIITK